MKKRKNKTGEYLHKEHPRTCAADDYWGQVSRTVNGVPVSKEQIEMIVNSIKRGLELSSGNKSLLDIACGNGALSDCFFENCIKFHGVDFSEYLINVAKKTFEKKPSFTFELSDAIEYVERQRGVEAYDTALCYGAFSYFSEDQAHRLLSALYKNFPNINLFYIGNLPDKDRVDQFLSERPHLDLDLNDSESMIGIWRTKDEFIKLANRSGWSVEFYAMPETFYAAHYRYDVVLKRKSQSGAS